jgi:hypothetical protein
VDFHDIILRAQDEPQAQLRRVSSLYTQGPASKSQIPCQHTVTEAPFTTNGDRVVVPPTFSMFSRSTSLESYVVMTASKSPAGARHEVKTQTRTLHPNSPVTRLTTGGLKTTSQSRALCASNYHHCRDQIVGCYARPRRLQLSWSPAAQWGTKTSLT